MSNQTVTTFLSHSRNAIKQSIRNTEKRLEGLEYMAEILRNQDSSITYDQIIQIQSEVNAYLVNADEVTAHSVDFEKQWVRLRKTLLHKTQNDEKENEKPSLSADHPRDTSEARKL